MSKKKIKETWPTEEEFAQDEKECEQEELQKEKCAGVCEECESKCDEMEDLASKYLQMAKEVKADFENYKKRNENSKREAFEDGKRSVVISILPCADAIDKAIEMVSDEQTKKGLELVSQKFSEVLKNLNVKKMECLGKTYDANIHNVIASIESDKPEGEIIQECISGYMIDDIVLRHAQVVVSKGTTK